MAQQHGTKLPPAGAGFSEGLVDRFHTEAGVLYLDDRAGLASLGPIFRVAQMRLGPYFSVIRVPAREIRKLVAKQRR